jgi:hypothetical protein
MLQHLSDARDVLLSNAFFLCVDIQVQKCYFIKSQSVHHASLFRKKIAHKEIA